MRKIINLKKEQRIDVGFHIKLEKRDTEDDSRQKTDDNIEKKTKNQ